MKSTQNWQRWDEAKRELQRLLHEAALQHAKDLKRRDEEYRSIVHAHSRSELPKDLETERAVLHCCLLGDVPRSIKDTDFGDEWNAWLFGRLRLLKRRRDWLQRLLSAKHRSESVLLGERRLPAAVARVMYQRTGRAWDTDYSELPTLVARLKRLAEARKTIQIAEARLRRAWDTAYEVANGK